jgi:hypothetical protein
MAGRLETFFMNAESNSRLDFRSAQIDEARRRSRRFCEGKINIWRMETLK